MSFRCRRKKRRRRRGGLQYTEVKEDRDKEGDAAVRQGRL